MVSAEQAGGGFASSESAVPGLEDLISIAVVIGAGCEPCTKSLVQRARRRGTPEALIAQTLGIVARMCSVECLVRALGPEVIERMSSSLQAGKQALRQAHGGVKDGACCG